jgi:hypothetical protein
LTKSPSEYFRDYEISMITVWESLYNAILEKSTIAANFLTLAGFFNRTFKWDIWSMYARLYTGDENKEAGTAKLLRIKFS